MSRTFCGLNTRDSAPACGAVEHGGFTISTTTKMVIDNAPIVYENEGSVDFVGIRLDGATNEDVEPIIRNNLIASTTSSATGVGVEQVATSSNRDESAPERFQNNAFHNVATLWDFTDAGITDLTAISDVNTESNTTLGATGTADGNVAWGEVVFNDPSNGNSDASDDFELGSSTTSDILDGGRDLLSDPGNVVTEDFNGVSRTVPFTIDAYESNGM